MSSNQNQQKRHFVRKILGIVSGLVLFIPLALGPFAGLTVLQTNSGVERPSPSLNFNYLGKLSTWLAERAAFKDLAIRFDGQIDRLIFRESASAGSASPRVIEGRGGVAFIVDAFSEACNPHIQTGLLVNQMKLLSQVIAKSGREFRLVVSPDKSSILRDFLPVNFALKNCFDSYNRDFWEKLERGGISGFVNLHSELLNARVKRREILFRSRDTHWDSAGAAMAAKTVVNSLVPDTWEDNLFKFSGLVELSGDLDALTGKTIIDTAPTYTLVRRDVIQVASDAIDQIDQSPNRRIQHTSKSSFLIPGRTLILGDSFSEAAAPFFLSYFEDVTLMRLSEFSSDKFITLIRKANNVLFWSVERSFPYRVAYDWGTDVFIDALRESLK